MSSFLPPIAISAIDIPARAAVSFYPEQFISRMDGRQKRQLGEFFGLKNFGVNLTRLAPNAVSSLRHSHAKQDEFVYVVSGHPTLHTDQGRMRLAPGMLFFRGYAGGAPSRAAGFGLTFYPTVALLISVVAVAVLQDDA